MLEEMMSPNPSPKISIPYPLAPANMVYYAAKGISSCKWN
jgi:hypothetical protein